MIKYLTSVAIVTLAWASASGAEIKISPKDPIVVSVPQGWEQVAENPPPGFPFTICRISAAGDRNASCLISVILRDRADIKDRELLKTVLRGDSRPYRRSAEEAFKIEIKEIPIQGGLGVYADFIDPDLVGKPVKKQDYKTTTLVILSIGSDYLIKATIFSDDLKGQDYREAMEMVKSIAIKPGA